MFGNILRRITQTAVALLCLVGSVQALSGEISDKNISGGEQFTVTLQDTPGTGYKWMLRTLPAPVMLVSENYRQPASCGKKATGCPVERTFTFRGVQQGTGDIHFAYGRPWLNMTEKTVTVRVRVRSDAPVR
ncbi:Putative proteinase inhibitor I42 [Sodalis praecaptivus]|uniref:Proteinase inhibitor I42 chagasin domain-containing protein n=1 Tax=Sodalis praecaptivus TaxID=1239307 RepID=W0HY22_9GAMM|nr:protease inhibitor I42 family protein [Sodalis praecaptivus]AHF78766.1 Putative proteinase inhibitor I42 [Sodalis praecaptivus]